MCGSVRRISATPSTPRGTALRKAAPAQAISTATPATPTARPPAHAPKPNKPRPKARAAHRGQPQQTRCRRHRRAPPVRHHAAGPQDPSQRRGIIRRGLPRTRQLHAHPAQPRRGRRRAARHRRGQGARGGQRPARKQRQPCPGDRAGAGLGSLEARTGKDAWRNPAPVREPGDDRIYYGHSVTSGDYLRFLAANGYTLAPVEEVITGTRTAANTYDTYLRDKENPAPDEQ